MTTTILEPSPEVTAATPAPRSTRSSLIWAVTMRQRPALSRLSLLVFLQVNVLQHVASFLRALLDRVVYAQAQAPGAFVARGLVWAVLLGVAAALCARSTARIVDVLEHDLRMWCFTRLTHQFGADQDAIAELGERALLASDRVVAAAAAARRVVLLAPFVLAPVLVTAKAMPVASLVFLAIVGGLVAVIPRAGNPLVVGAAGVALAVAVGLGASQFLRSGHHIWPVRSHVSDGLLFVFLQAVIAVVPFGAALITVGMRRAPLLDAQDELEEIFARAVAPRSWGAGLPAHDATLSVAFRGERFSAKPGQLVVVHAPDERTRTRLAHNIAGLEASTTTEVVLGDVAVTDLDPAAVLDAVRLLTEAPLLVPGTVAENLCLGRVDEPIAAQLDAACHAAGLHLDVDGPIDDFDATLELADRQRLALARALISDARLLVLDDALSSLSDADTTATLRAVRAQTPDAIVVYLTTRHVRIPGARTATVPSLNGHGRATPVLRRAIRQESPKQRFVAGIGGAKLDQAGATGAGRYPVAAAIVAIASLLFLAPGHGLGPTARVAGLLVAVLAPLWALHRWASGLDLAAEQHLRDRFVADVALGRAAGFDDAVRERFAADHWDAQRGRSIARTLASAAHGVTQVAAAILPLVVLGALADRNASVVTRPTTLAAAGLAATVLAAATRDAALRIGARA